MILGRKLLFPKHNQIVRSRSTVTQSMDNNGVGRDSLRTKFTQFPLFYAQIRDTKLFFENNLITLVDSKKIAQCFLSSLSVLDVWK